MLASWWWRGRAFGQRFGVARHVGEPLQEHAVRQAAVEGVRVVPPLGEDLEHVGHHRPTELHRGVVPGGVVAVPGSIDTGCGSPWCAASSRRLWHRSMPPTKATSRAGSFRCWITKNFWWCEPNTRTRWSSRTSPPASLIFRPSSSFDRALIDAETRHRATARSGRGPRPPLARSRRAGRRSWGRPAASARRGRRASR